jgi:thiamine kinase-like enzyme
MTPRVPRTWTSLGLSVSRVTPLSRTGAARVFRLDLDDGRTVKGRIFPTAFWAARVQRLLETRRAHSLPRPMIRAGRVLVLEFVEGTPLDEWLPGRGRASERHAARLAGGLIARLHSGRPLPGAAPTAARYAARMRATLSALTRSAALERDVAERLSALATPTHARTALTHGDICPENLIRTKSGDLRPIDEERLAMRPLAYDLARAVNRWPLDASLERALLNGYSAEGGKAGGFRKHRVFWLSAALATSAEYRLKQRPETLRPILEAMRALALTCAG